MSFSDEHRESTYVIDVNDDLEMSRLVNQDRFLTTHLGGVFSELQDVSTIHTVLDLACGSGGWALQVAETFPQMTVIGIDISASMVQFAQAQALVRGISNARFYVMDIRQPFTFSDNAFDLINARLLFGVLQRADWPSMLQECRRITRLGGILRLMEMEEMTSNAPANEHLISLFTTGLVRAHQSFSPDGRHLGITPMLGKFLCDAGYQDINQTGRPIDYSYGAEAHDSAFQNIKLFLQLVQPFLIKMKMETQEELDIIYQNALAEWDCDDFRALAWFVTAWGRKCEM